MGPRVSEIGVEDDVDRPELGDVELASEVAPVMRWAKLGCRCARVRGTQLR